MLWATLKRSLCSCAEDAGTTGQCELARESGSIAELFLSHLTQGATEQMYFRHTTDPEHSKAERKNNNQKKKSF